MNDHRALFRHIGMIEGRAPASSQWLRMMSPAAEHVGGRHDDKCLSPGHHETRVEIGQKCHFAFAPARYLVPIRETFRPNAAHPLHRTQVLFLRRDEDQSRARSPSLLDESAKGFPRGC